MSYDPKKDSMENEEQFEEQRAESTVRIASVTLEVIVARQPKPAKAEE
jgi:hypothetical protein